ncbi:MAG: hypothetical protein BGO12_13155 [Verrucomicrobia bacterium 61-8]|nr:histidine kinase [Verrucomicrobiota bacterium]OJV17583.1 MAG: hypothetical protein BGO12_13155 [Verrucomicrobia bacterium 61-8]
MWSKLPPFWKYQIGGWTVYALIAIPVKWALFHSFSGALISFYRELLGLILTYGMYLVYRRIYGRWRVSRILPIVFALSFAGSALEMLASFALHNVIVFEEADFSSDATRMGALYYRTAVFAGWSFLYFVFRLIYESKDLQNRLAEALAHHRESEIQLLRSQMNPHFLFNALASLRACVERSRDEFRSVIQALGNYLRYSLDHGSDCFVSLGAEFEATRDYLEVEKVRFQDDLDVQTHIDDGARTVPIPGVILQPLVENAVKYGRETSERPLKVRLRVTRPTSGRVRIAVSNSGRWQEPQETEKSSHLGLQNLRRRLELLYGQLHQMKIAHDNGWVTVTLDIPTA